MGLSLPQRRERAIDPAERRARIDLAACHRLIALYGMDDLFATHISLRLPGQADRFLLSPFGLLFRQVTASSLVAVGLDGTVLEDGAPDINQAGFLIHAAIHAARPDVACIIHTHTVAGIAVSCLEEGLLPLQQKSMRFHGRVAYHDYEGLAEDPEECRRLARDLGSHDAMILRNHGLLACGGSVRSVFRSMYELEKICQVQLAALATGRPLRLVSGTLLAHAAAQFQRVEEPDETARDAPRRARQWEALLAMLDRLDPGYRE